MSQHLQGRSVGRGVLALILTALAAAMIGYSDGAVNSRRFNIGGVLHSNQTRHFFSKTLLRINFDGESVAEETTLYEVMVTLRGSPITTALLVCDSLITKGVYAVVIAGPPGESVTTAAVSYTTGFFHIPVICTSSRDSAFSDKNIHVSFLRTVPPYSHQADVWLALLKHLKYRQAILIHSSDSDGRALHTRFQNLARGGEEDTGIKVASVVEFRPGLESFVKELSAVRDQLVKVILVYASREDAETIFHDADYLNMTDGDFVWIVTEQALDSALVPIGTLGLQLRYAHDVQAHVDDALRVVALALKKLHEDEEFIQEPPISCDKEDYWGDTGRTLFRMIREQVLIDGKTGRVAFDEHGDRTNAEYSIVNVQERRMLATVGDFLHQTGDAMNLSLNLSSIVWPGGSYTQPRGYSMPTHLRVMTIQETPFVYAEPVTDTQMCLAEDEVLCPFTNISTQETKLMCCWGYCIDLLLELSRINNFSYTLELSPDGQYGEYDYNDEGKKEWSGLIGELTRGVEGVDLVLAPLTINPERSQAIDFSKPFKYHGITILIKRGPKGTALVSILQPFRDTLWLLLLATVHVIALLVWILDHLSPMYKMVGGDTDSLSISESLWFSWAVILNSGLTEGTPRCLSGRVLGIVWAGFAMIMVASYTANLAAFLVLESPINDISGINDARLRNPVENFTFATVKGSAVDMFFRRKTELANMYRVMEAHNYDTADQAIQAVRDGNLHAFIWESSRLEYEASQDCDLVTVGELFGRSGFGIGLRKGSPWSEKITIDILELHERGFMEKLDRSWIWNDHSPCQDLFGEDFSKRLGLKNLEGIFLMVAGGIFTGIILVFIEILYDRCKSKHGQAAPQNHRRGNNDDQHDAENRTGTKGLPPSINVSSGHRGSTTSDSRSNNVMRNEYERHTPSDENGGITSSLHLSGNQEVFQDVEERLKNSPNIPEEWKTRTALEWFQFYLDTLKMDAAGDSSEAVAILEDFEEFVKETGITDLKDLYPEEMSGKTADPEIDVGDAEGISYHVERWKFPEKVSSDTTPKYKKTSFEQLPDVVDTL
ncbi:glutamate [NMDA] receptor subunit 1-like isoform X1 [Penaeus chinensis]|uniref:glutamate [NMDA] receptor subunit 1-like isoform X1 n=1 Tax=Penaeus chinensis TaxID=139456 RepID=UPI001FB7A02A|nr:glutamate [NMDA] receptor subunit 1-like isoform X1 [Penaeus chinensis]